MIVLSAMYDFVSTGQTLLLDNQWNIFTLEGTQMSATFGGCYAICIAWELQL